MLYDQEARYCIEHKCWYTYSAGAWRRDEGAILVSEKIKDFVRLMILATCGQTALEDLAVARDTVLKQIDEQIAYAGKYGSLEEVEMLGDIRQSIEDDYAAQEEAIKSELNTIFESIQEGMIGKISDTKEALEDEWDDMNWFEHWWYDHDEEKYVRQGLQDLQGHIDTISKAIQGHMDDLETNGSAWADDAMQRKWNLLHGKCWLLTPEHWRWC